MSDIPAPRPQTWGICSNCGHSEGDHILDDAPAGKCCVGGLGLCDCPKYKIGHHTFHLTPDEVLRLEAIFAIGLLTMKQQQMIAFLVQAPQSRMHLQLAMAKLAGHTSPELWMIDPNGEQKSIEGLESVAELVKELFLPVVREIRNSAREDGVIGT